MEEEISLKTKENKNQGEDAKSFESGKTKYKKIQENQGKKRGMKCWRYKTNHVSFPNTTSISS